jgi:hypothetical protein
MKKPSLIRDVTPNRAGFSGACVHCGNPAAKEVLLKDEGIVIIERYCATCSEPTEFQSLKEWYSRI